MAQHRKVKTIPATLTRFTSAPITEQKKRRVAGYARVSTDHDDQFTSYEAQIDYYTKYIKSRDDWEFVQVYTDEGITGTSTKRREGFRTMVADALDGKIDLIVTKSVSRFARNTVDSLTTIRQLKEKGIEVYFEKENIWTFDGKGELLLTIMSSLAQEESRSISENCTWGQRKRFADGKVSVAYKRFLGYDKGADGNLVINPEQAVTIRSTRNRLTTALGREPTLQEIGRQTGFTPEEIALAETATAATESIQRETGDEGFSLEDVLTDTESEERMVEKIALRQAVRALPERERQIIALRYFHGLTQQRTAGILGISQVQVSRVERKALGLLKEKLE